jgi:hypothetical protein
MVYGPALGIIRRHAATPGGPAVAVPASPGVLGKESDAGSLREHGCASSLI